MRRLPCGSLYLGLMLFTGKTLYLGLMLFTGKTPEEVCLLVGLDK